MEPSSTLDPKRDIDAALRRLIQRSLERDPGPIRRSDRFDAMGFDELARAHFAYHVQRAFHVNIDPGHGTRPETVGEVLELIEARTYWTYPAAPQETALDLARGGFLRRFLRPPVQAMVRIFLRLFFHFRAYGRTCLPRSGPFVLVANHSGHPDAPALMAAVPLRRVNDTHPLAAQDYFFSRRLVGRAVHFLVNALPIDRHSSAERAMKAALDLLAEGRGIILFPEGSRSTTGEIRPFKIGVGLVLAGKPFPAIPAYIEGSRAILPKGARWPRRARLRVNIGRPLWFEGVPDTREGWSQVAADLEAEVRNLQSTVAMTVPEPST